MIATQKPYRAEVGTDDQFGPYVRFYVQDVQITVWIADETGGLVGNAGAAGIEVNGDWPKFKRQLDQVLAIQLRREVRG